jgi:hypothetical protein
LVLGFQGFLKEWGKALREKDDLYPYNVGGYLKISMNFPLKKSVGIYILCKDPPPQGWEEKITLYLECKTILLLRSRCKNPPSPFIHSFISLVS